MGLSRSSFAFAIFAWSLLILRFGYQYGTGDQTELLPYVLFLNDPGLYSQDFFIQSLHASLPHERTVMAYLLLPFVNYLELTCFIFHLIVTVVLILGLEKFALRFLKSRYIAWLAILITLIPLSEVTLGGVILYSECLQASYVSIALCIWGINVFFDKRYILSSLLLSIATFIHVLEGLDVMIVLSLIMFILVMQQKVSHKNCTFFWLIFTFTAGIYLLLILKAKSNPTALSNELMFKIMFEFRHPHHYIFSSFSKTKTIGFFFLSLLALFYFNKRSNQVWYFVAISLVGILGYIVATDHFHLIPIANFQFYKLAQWLKFMGIVAATGLIFEKTGLVKNLSWKVEISLFAAGTLACLFIIFKSDETVPFKVPHQIFSLKQKDEMIDICTKISTSTPNNAVFIQPIANSELKFYARRSSYVEYKANVKNRQYVGEWYSRIQEVFGINYQMPEKGFEVQQKADDYFYHLPKEALEDLKEKGVTHILTKKELPPSIGSLTLSNNTYAVYQL